jgi:hypothetical protein
MKIICIDDKGRPQEIPTNKWPKKDNEYTPIRVFYHPMQGVQGVELQEIRLTKENYPYESYKLQRFGVRPEDLEELIELIKASNDLNDVDINIKELEEILL